MVAVTRRDVAELAGTSPAVVSYVLNDGPRSVAPMTRTRVLAAVQQLGYRPNRIARSLRTSRTMTLGLVVPDNSNPFFAELARAIEEAAFAASYTLLIGNATDDEERQATYFRTFLDRQVDGLLLIPAHASLACLEELQQSGIPWVIVDRYVPESTSAPQVVVDNYNGAYVATRHLLGHDRRRVACIAGPSDASPAPARVAGWRAAFEPCRDQGALPPLDHALRRVPFGQYAGYEAALDLLTRLPSPDALFVTSDQQAIGALRAVSELGLSCPGDVAIASFDGIPASAYTQPALTTMQQPFAALGQAAVDALVDRITRADAEPSTTVYSTTLVTRRSCGCPDPPWDGSARYREQTPAGDYVTGAP